MICASCGADNREGARFCDACGGALLAEPVREQRKVVTVLFCDVTGSTALGESLDPEALRAVMARYFDVARIAIERHGGTLEKFIGDAVMAVFGVPTVREDDALRAVRAAQELRDAVEIDVRIGINTGEVVTGSGDSLVTGDAVNVAARLEQAAAPGDVLLGAGTYALVRDAVEVDLLPPIEAKGKSEPVTAYRLRSVTGDAAYARRADAPLVGRDRESRLLRDAWERATSERASALFTVLGTAGVGKSRLAAEFVSGLDDATVVRGTCLSYGEGITYWPVVEVVKQLLGDSPPPDPAIAALLGNGQAPADDIAFAVRKLFESVAAVQPLVVVFDDVHWAEPTFLDLIEHVIDWSRGAPILLLCLARPDLLELRTGWGGGKLNATTVLLEPLSEIETDELIDALLTGRDLDPLLRERIRAAADGNPLFVEQMLAMVEESPESVSVPATIQALLSARLDQLPGPERAALERGAVEGQVFHRGAVAALGPDDANLTSHLFGLVRKELVRPSAGTLPGDDAFRFRHLLIRDAAYEALPKAARADLHERFAAWLEERVPDLVELDEILGYHLEQAALYLAELGTPSAELARRAAERLGAAGRRAARRRDTNAGISLLRRALELTPSASPHRAEVLGDLGWALYDLGEMAEAATALRGAVDGGALDVSARAVFWLAIVECHLGGRFEDGERTISERLAAVAGLGADDRTLAEGHLASSQLLFWNGRTSEVAAAAKQAQAHAIRAGDTMLEVEATGNIGVGLVYGTARWPEVEEHCHAALQQVDRLGPTALNARLGLAGAAAAQGRFEEARLLYQEHRAYMEERGQAFALLSNAQAPAACELLAGDFGRAEELLRASWEGLGRLGERGYRSTAGAILAEALAEQGRLDEALQIVDEAIEIAGEDDWVTTAHCHWARALVASRSGDHDGAVEHARKATEVADTRDYIYTRTHYWLGLGRVLVAAGRVDEAREAIAEARRLCAIKGTTAYDAALGRFEEQLAAYA